MGTTIYRALKEHRIVVRGDLAETVEAVGARTGRPLSGSKGIWTRQACTSAFLISDNEMLAKWYDETAGVSFDDLAVGSLICYDLAYEDAA